MIKKNSLFEKPKKYARGEFAKENVTHDKSEKPKQRIEPKMLLKDDVEKLAPAAASVR